MKASFRGVEFSTIEHQILTGRRQPSYAVPFQDNGARSIDMGRAPRRFKFVAVVVDTIDNTGAPVSYRIARNKLLDAFEQPGPGVLVHPEFGRLRVIVGDDVSVRESTDAVNRADITFTAIEAADQQVQRAKPDAAGLTRAAKQAVIDASAAKFESSLPFPAVADFVSDAHLDQLDRCLDSLRTMNNAVHAVLSVPSGFATQIDAISLQAADLLHTPRELYNTIADTMLSIAQSTRRILGPDGEETDVSEVGAAVAPLSRTSDTAGSLEQAAKLAADLGAGAPPIPVIATDERNEERDGRAGILQTLRGTMLAALADAALDHRWDSRADALAVRAAICEPLIDLANADDTDQALSEALRDCASGLSRFLGQISETMTFYTLATTLPAEVLAYDLYDDAERADEICTRNRVANPGALQGLTTLEVESS